MLQRKRRADSVLACVGLLTCVGLLALCSCRWAPVRSQPDERPAAPAAQVIESENTIESLRQALADLSRSVRTDRAWPGFARNTLDSEVRFVDLASAPAAGRQTILDVEVSRGSWPVAQRDERCSRSPVQAERER